MITFSFVVSTVISLCRLVPQAVLSPKVEEQWLPQPYLNPKPVIMLISWSTE